jgi:hypothetical protein
MTGNMLAGYHLFVILDVYGHYWFAPYWDTEMNYYLRNFSTGLTVISVLPQFIWPENVGSGSGIVFWGALLDSLNTQLIGSYSRVEFGWES